MTNDQLQLWTVGHSNQTFAEFRELLDQHAIELLADIRRFPASRKFPHFSRENLQATLTEHSIKYQWLEDLGGRRSSSTSASSANDAWRNRSFRNYADYMQTPEFQRAFDQLIQFAQRHRTAMMCSESVFWRCHRRLVSDFAVASGVHVEHIFPNGETKPHTLTTDAVIKSHEPVTVVYPGPPTLFD